MSSYDIAQVAWRKSARCGGNGTCVEIAQLPAQQIGARDSKRGDVSPVLAFSTADWHSFVTQVKDGDFDLGH